MMRLLPGAVVAAYQHTGRIPIRLAWTSTDDRGGCAMDAVAQSMGLSTDEFRAKLDTRYEVGFLTAWDADNPDSSEIREFIEAEDAAHKLGYCDGVVCRREVERVFSSLIPVPNDE